MAARIWSLFSRDADYRLSGGLPLSSFKGVKRHINYATAIVETPYTEDAFARTAPGCGFVVYRDGRHEFSGLVGSERTMGWDADSGQPTIKVQVVGDDKHLANRLVYPDPAREGHDQTTADYWQHNGVASTALWRLVNEQLGPSARPERRVPTLYMGSDPGVGTSRVWQAQNEPVMTVAARWSALSTPSPGITVTSTASGLRCDITQPRDLADEIRFSADLRNLTGFSYTETAPEVTYALVAGQGELRNRMRRSATSTNPLDLRWGQRIETYIDRRDEDDPAALQTEADDAITEGQGQVNLTCTLTDTEAATYGRDWDLGDRVTVYVGLPGQAKAAVVTDIVREISLEVDNTGAETIRPAIGGHDAKAVRPTPDQQTIARIGRTLEGFFARK